MQSITEILRKQAAEIARAGHNGWGNTMLCAAEEIDRLRADVARIESLHDLARELKRLRPNT